MAGGKTKIADIALDRIMLESERETLTEFLDSGERLWIRLKKVVKFCGTACSRPSSSRPG
jgi:hypothetical protein